MKRPLNLAHRGASGHAPENTLAAIKLAMELDADGIEFDVHLSRDGQVILLHDDTLQRTSNGQGFVWDFAAFTLQKLDAGSWFSSHYANEPIPTLQQVLDYAQDRLYLNIEIKAGTGSMDLAAKVVEILHYNGCSSFVITSFDQSALEEVRKLDSSIQLGLIFETDRKIGLAGDWPIVSTEFHLVDREFVDQCRGADKKIFVWTVNEEQDMERLIGLGVDGIITNYPDRLAKLLNVDIPF